MLKSEIIGPSGSGGPLETGHVICPACAHNFPAIPQNARERIAVLEAALTKIYAITYEGDPVHEIAGKAFTKLIKL